MGYMTLDLGQVRYIKTIEIVDIGLLIIQDTWVSQLLIILEILFKGGRKVTFDSKTMLLHPIDM
jgi:hypothetical protein